MTEIERPQEKPLSGLERLYQILINPGKVFESIMVKPNVLLPLLVVFVVTALHTFILRDDLKVQLDETIRNAPQLAEASMDAATLQSIIDMQFNVTLGIVLISAFLAPLIGGAISHLISMFMSGEGSFKESISVTTNSSIIGALGALCALPIAFMTHNYGFTFSAATFMIKDPFSPVYVLMSMLNVFLLWQLAVTVMGFKKIHEFGMIKAAIAVLTPTFVMILISVVPLLTMKK